VLRGKNGSPPLKKSADHEIRLAVEELLWAAGRDEAVKASILEAIRAYREKRDGGSVL